MNWKKITGILILVGILGAAYVWFFVYNKPHRDYEAAKPDFVLTASSCYNYFAMHKKDYTGKVLQIKGIAQKVETDDSLVVIVFVFNEGMFGDEGIRCTLLPKYHEQAKTLNLKKPVTVKGYCTGFNDTDVILENCSIIKK